MHNTAIIVHQPVGLALDLIEETEPGVLDSSTMQQQIYDWDPERRTFIMHEWYRPLRGVYVSQLLARHERDYLLFTTVMRVRTADSSCYGFLVCECTYGHVEGRSTDEPTRTIQHE